MLMILMTLISGETLYSSVRLYCICKQNGCGRWNGNECTESIKVREVAVHVKHTKKAMIGGKDEFSAKSETEIDMWIEQEGEVSSQTDWSEASERNFDGVL